MKKTIFLFITFLCLQKIAAQNGLCFTTPQIQPFLANSWMTSTAKADFNNDGVDDICTHSYYGVSLFLSNGTGSFTALTTLTLSMSTDAVITNDFNNDGNADIAAFNTNSNEVIIILGTGTGTILSSSSFSTFAQPKSITSGDFNNDGKADLAIVNSAANSVSIYNNLGNGTFTYVVSYGTGLNPSIIIAGDFNNNGNLDLLVNSDNASFILKGNGSSLFAVSTFSNLSAGNLITKDINSDNKLDILFTPLYGSSVNVLSGNGNYTFNFPVSYSLNTGSAALNGLYFEDANNDGLSDILCMSFNGSTLPSYLTIFYGINSGTFTGPLDFMVSSSGFTYPFGFIPADLNNDGKLDVLANLDNGGGLNILYNCNTVNIKEIIDNEFMISVYPNPASDVLNVSFNLEGKELFSKIRILNNLSQLIKEEDVIFKDKIISIQTNELKNGIYFLNLQNDKSGSISRKFVVVH